ncbi:MAG: DUF433 domain-containing protein [Deltaproteobacteria bacterium]|nr:DUF433 domain-containing protein [Deltaproteobacteria bacterium]MBI3391437.1 DUF433 domain-containing protein [Deltaproteobacteria bacterium]
MTDPILLKRITATPEIFGGKPIIRGMRISVELILSLLAAGREMVREKIRFPVGPSIAGGVTTSRAAPAVP